MNTFEPTLSRAAEIRVSGVVQGVGFRPAVYRLARAHGLSGWVRNDGMGVRIAIEGPAPSVDDFLAALPRVAPPAARIETLEVVAVPPSGHRSFEVLSSRVEAGPAAIPPDRGPCEACLAELEDPSDRRFRHPFVNCTDCGPRYTIVEALPYDRERTTMRGFPLCDACAAEYDDPFDRRYHAEPVACPRCGPRLTLRHAGRVLRGDEALEAATRLLLDGFIVAVKAVGGFTLVVDATRSASVERLRELKRRPHKPFAVMVADVEQAAQIALVRPEHAEVLRSPVRPIVLLPSRGVVAREVAPGLNDIGVFLPPSPLQQLLLRGGPPIQVVTSGNVEGEPLVIDDSGLAELERLSDAVLTHDRPIRIRADDSVIRPMGGTLTPIRRSRGYVPEAIQLTEGLDGEGLGGEGLDGPVVLAVGGQLKNTVCLAGRGQAVLSAHVGNLGRRAAMAAFEQAIEHLQRLTGRRPELVACDAHPDYDSTRWARRRGLPVVEVQHHHAHVVACLVEHGHRGPAIGVAFDGTGYGPDGAMWGGEFLRADLRSFTRLGTLRPLSLLGGEAAVRQPWRLALAALLDAGEPLDLLPGNLPLEALRRMHAHQLGVPSHGAGRWFDAVAALCGLRHEVSYEGQAAAELEAIAVTRAAPYPFALTDGVPFEVDLRPTIRALAADLREGAPRSLVASRFHETIAHVIRDGCRRAGARTVALSGGCFQNRRLTLRTAELLATDAVEVLTHRRVPPNDGGIALGQAAVALARYRGRS